MHIEFLCSLCLFNSVHDKEHHIIDINKKESLENNNISLDKSISEFDETLKKLKRLKLKIEDEIEKADNSYKNIKDKITISFKKKHFELDEKEKKLKMELKFKKNEIKDELGDYLTKLKQILQSCETTHEVIENYENKNNEMKNLYYISFIQDNEKKANEFSEKKMKNLNISFNYDSLVSYENYYFNGVTIPKDIKAEKRLDQLFISWNIDDIGIKNIKYYISIKRDDYELIYESNNKYFYYEYFINNINYEIKVRTFVDNCYSVWSDAKNFIYEKKSMN